MKKLITSIICVFLITGSALAAGKPLSKFKQGVIQYKAGNFLGCMQTMEEVAATDPGNAIAHYYLAMAYVQAGKKEQALQEYDKVVKLNTNTQLTSYAQKGIQALGGPAPVEAATAPGTKEGQPVPPPSTQPAMTEGGINITPPGQDFMSEQAKNTLRERSLNTIINNTNQGNQVDPNVIKNVDDFSKKKSDNSAVSQEEIAKAMQTLQKAGINTGMNQSINPEMMQMNMLMSSLGGGNNMNSGMGSNPMSMLPMMMMSQGAGNKQNMDPQMMESMIMNMMMPNLFSSNNNDNNNSNY